MRFKVLVEGPDRFYDISPEERLPPREGDVLDRRHIFCGAIDLIQRQLLALGALVLIHKTMRATKIASVR